MNILSQFLVVYKGQNIAYNIPMLSVTEQKKYRKEVCGLAFHSSLQELFAVFANMLNSLMLTSIGQVYLSATTLAGQFISIYVYSSLGLTLAVLMNVTQYFGKNDLSSIKKMMHVSLLYSSLLSLIFFLLSWIFPTQIMSAITNDTELIPIGSNYLKYYSFVFLFSAFSKIYMTILKADGKAKVNTIISIVSIVSNFVITLMLVFGFFTGLHLNAYGAALASSASALIEMLLFFFYCLLFGKIKFSLFELFKIDRYFAKEIFRYSLPSIITKFSWSTAYMLLVSFIGHMSRPVIDAFAYIKIFSNIPNAFFTGFGIAFGVVLGHELGKGNIKTAKDIANDGRKFTRIIAISSFFLMIILGISATYFAKIDTDTLRFAYIYITILFAYQFLGGAFINFYNMGPFTAGGEVEFLALLDTFNMWVIMLPVTWLLCNVLKVPEYISLIYIFSNEFTKIYIANRHFKKYVWARDLTVNEWFLPLEGSFIDKYKRDLGLRLNISLTEFFTKRYENTTDFIFSLKKENYSKVLEDLSAYLKNIKLDDNATYKTVLAMEEIYTTSRKAKEKLYGKDCRFNCDIGVKLKDDKIRFIYYDNGPNIKDALSDKENTSIQVLTSISDKLEYNRVLNLNKILVRINRK